MSCDVETVCHNYLVPVDSWLGGSEFATWYPGSGRLVSQAADFVGVKGKTVLVIGTQHPWLEAILLRY